MSGEGTTYNNVTMDIATTKSHLPRGQFCENKPAAQAAGADPSR